MPAVFASLGCVAVSSEDGVWLTFLQSPFSHTGSDGSGVTGEVITGIMCSLSLCAGLLLVVDVDRVGGDALLYDLVLAIEVQFVLLGTVVFDKRVGTILPLSCVCLQQKMNKEMIRALTKPHETTHAPD